VYLVLYKPSDPLININFSGSTGITLTGLNLWNTGYPNTFGDPPLVRIEKADINNWPANPFQNTGPYSVTMYSNSLFYGQGGSQVESMGIQVANWGSSYTPNRVDNLYFYNNYFDHSTVGLFTKLDAYDSYPTCDSMQPSYQDNLSSYTPRNVRIEGNTFYNVGQGALSLSDARWVGVRNNTFNNDSGVHNSGGDFGGVMFVDQCANTIQITNNTIVGAPVNSYTDGVEVYGKNITISDNTLSGLALDGIALHNAANVTIQANTIRDNNWHLYVGGIHLDNNIVGGRQGDNITLIQNKLGNTTTTNQKYGLRMTNTPGVPIPTRVTVDSSNNFNYGNGNNWKAACYSSGYLPLQGYPQNPQNITWAYSGTFLPDGGTFPWTVCQ
jgi:parallel beta-helix repeat protein